MAIRASAKFNYGKNGEGTEVTICYAAASEQQMRDYLRERPFYLQGSMTVLDGKAVGNVSVDDFERAQTHVEKTGFGVYPAGIAEEIHLKPIPRPKDEQN